MERSKKKLKSQAGNILLSSLIILAVGATVVFISYESLLMNQRASQGLQPAGLISREALMALIATEAKSELQKFYCENGKSFAPIFKKDLPFSSKTPKEYPHGDPQFKVEQKVSDVSSLVVRSEENIRAYLEKNEDPNAIESLKNKTFRLHIKSELCKEPLLKTKKEDGSFKTDPCPSVGDPPKPNSEAMDYVAFLNTDYFSCPCSRRSIASQDNTSCAELLANDSSLKGQDGEYTISSKQDPKKKLKVYCDMTTDGGGWTLFGHMASGGSANYSMDYGTTLAAGNVIASKPDKSTARVRVEGSYSAPSCSSQQVCYNKRSGSTCPEQSCANRSHSACSWTQRMVCTPSTKTEFNFDLKEKSPTPAYQPIFDIKRNAGWFENIISQENVTINIGSSIAFSTEVYGGMRYAMLAGGAGSTLAGQPYGDGRGQGIWWAIIHETPVYGYYCRNTMDICAARYPNNFATGRIAKKLQLFYREELSLPPDLCMSPTASPKADSLVTYEKVPMIAVVSQWPAGSRAVQNRLVGGANASQYRIHFGGNNPWRSQPGGPYAEWDVSPSDSADERIFVWAIFQQDEVLRYDVAQKVFFVTLASDGTTQKVFSTDAFFSEWRSNRNAFINQYQCRGHICNHGVLMQELEALFNKKKEEFFKANPHIRPR